MNGASRTFKLRLSPAGMDMLIEAHCLLIRATRQLAPWGTTLYAAVVHLETFAPEAIRDGLARVADARLWGADNYFLGAPGTLKAVATKIAERAASVSPDGRHPPLMQIYLLALETFVAADQAEVRRAYFSLSSSEPPQSR